MGEREFQVIRDNIDKKIEEAKIKYAQATDKKNERTYLSKNYAENEKELAKHIDENPEILTFQDVNGNNIMMDMVGKWCFENWGFGHLANYCLKSPKFKQYRPIFLSQLNNNGENVAIVSLLSGDNGFFELTTMDKKAKEQAIEYLIKHNMVDVLEKYSSALKSDDLIERE